MVLTTGGTEEIHEAMGGAAEAELEGRLDGVTNQPIIHAWLWRHDGWTLLFCLVEVEEHLETI